RGPAGLLELVEILRCCADIEAVIHQALLFGHAQLLLDSLLRGGRGTRVRHFKEGRDTPFRTCSSGMGEVFLVRKTRLAKMHLVVDDAWEQIKAFGVNVFVGG